MHDAIAGIGSHSADTADRAGVARQPVFADALDPDIGGHAPDVIGFVGAAAAAVFPFRAISGADLDLVLAEMFLDRGQRQPKFVGKTFGCHARARRHDLGIGREGLRLEEFAEKTFAARLGVGRPGQGRKQGGQDRNGSKGGTLRRPNIAVGLRLG